MDAVDVSDHYDVAVTDQAPSLLSVIIDTNPRAWAALDTVLPLARAVANILVFVNAHLSFSNANQVAIIAAHVNRAVWLYPPPPPPSVPPSSSSSSSSCEAAAAPTTSADDVSSGDVHMDDAPSQKEGAFASANKCPQFAEIETVALSSLRKLMADTTEAHLASTTTQLSGALTLALCHSNKAAQALSSTAAGAAAASALPAMKGRIVVISVSDPEPSQYIPTMNAVFAAAHARLSVDTLSLYGNHTFLQQAAFNTGGTYISAANPRGLISYLMFGLVADNEARQSLVTPTGDTVDFRAACFCHGNVIDTGFVCSICLSIFCEIPPDAACLTCGTKLALGTYGSKPAVVPRKKKKRRRIVNGTSREDTGSATGTPRP